MPPPGRPLAAWRTASPAATAGFAAAAGDWEFQTDGTAVEHARRLAGSENRHLRQASAGRAGDAGGVGRASLPRPSARWAFAAVQECDAFSADWGPRRPGLGLLETAELSVIADGAAWIWCAAAAQFPGSQGLIDIYHACQYLADVARVAFAADADAAAGWLDRARGQLLSDGWQGWCVIAGALLATKDTPAVREAVEATTGYLAGHTEHLGYRQRLAAGPVDRQRDGRGGVQAGNRPPAEANGGALAGRSPQSHGGTLLRLLQQLLGRLLDRPRCLIARIKNYTL